MTIRTAEELAAALAAAVGGEVIALEQGDYGTLTLPRGYGEGFAAPVTIRSRMSSARAVFTRMVMERVANIRLDSLDFSYIWKPGDRLGFEPFRIEDSRNVTVIRCLFEGDIAGGGDPVGIGYATGRGLAASGNTGFSFINCKMLRFWKGLGIARCNDVRVRRSEFYHMRCDGLNGNAVQGCLIEYNYFHDFIRAPDSDDHADFIQFASANATRPTTDLTIRDNLLDIGAGDRTQVMFMRNDQVDTGLAGDGMFWRNLLIEDNMILADHHHGLYVGETDGLVIRNNVLRHKGPDRGEAGYPCIVVQAPCRAVTITGNEVYEIVNPQPGWVVQDNLTDALQAH